MYCFTREQNIMKQKAPRWRCFSRYVRSISFLRKETLFLTQRNKAAMRTQRTQRGYLKNSLCPVRFFVIFVFNVVLPSFFL